jgi:hypothetical protein
MKFVVHTTETAPPASREDLETAEKLFGFVPNLLGVLAAAPLALAYIILTKLLEDASLSPVEQQVVMLAGSHENGADTAWLRTAPLPSPWECRRLSWRRSAAGPCCPTRSWKRFVRL